MKNIFWFWSEELSDETVDRIKRTCEKEKSESAGVYKETEGGEDPSSDVVETIRISDVSWIEDKEINEIIWHYVLLANEEAFGFNITKNKFDVQYTKYSGDKKGFYDWHKDNNFTNNKFKDRKLSIVIQLTDHKAYEGGGFEFDIDGKIMSVEGFEKKGSIIVFPSFTRHRVVPVTKGIRNSLVSWIEGPHFV